MKTTTMTSFLSTITPQRKIAVRLIALCMALCGCATKKDHVVSDANVLELDSLFQREFSADQPGAAILIAKGDRIVFSKGYGLANLTTKEPITPKTLFNLGSISKTFVANGILLLEQQGKLSVEDPLEKYFPDFKNKSIAKKVKIKHLLTHTSGLPDNRQTWKDTVFYLTAKDAENWAPELLVDSLEFEPGTNFHYSNPAFNGLALILEKVSGVAWQQFIKTNIFDQAGMKTSTITDGPHPQQGVSHCYIKIAGQWREDDYGEEPTFAAAGNGGVWSSTEELALYERVLRDSIFLNASRLDDARMPKNNIPVHSLAPLETSEWNIGWSWFIGRTSEGVKLAGHAGTQGGFYCNYIALPEKKIVFVLLSNFPCDREKISANIMRWLASKNYLE